MIAELITRLFHARTNAHLLHLGVTGPGSFAAHKALNEFYDSIVDLADSIAEGYQGEHELISFTGKCVYRHVSDPLKLVSELKEWIEQNRYEAIEAEDTFLHNIVDEVIQLCSTTIYKLKNLK